MSLDINKLFGGKSRGIPLVGSDSDDEIDDLRKAGPGIMSVDGRKNSAKLAKSLKRGKITRATFTYQHMSQLGSTDAAKKMQKESFEKLNNLLIK